MCVAAVSRVALSRVIVCGCSVGSNYEGRVYIKNVVRVVFRRLTRCLVSTVSRAIGSGDVVTGAVMVVYVVSRVIILGDCGVGGCCVGVYCVDTHSVGRCGVGG